MSLLSSPPPSPRAPPRPPSTNDDDDGLVFLPLASAPLELVCVALYLTLALVSACRALSLSALTRAKPATTFPRSTFQRLLVLFALTRAASFLTLGVARNLVNRAALCLFFSLVLFQTLQWIDIANPKLSRRSRRIWIAFLVANGLFYVTVLGLSVFHEAQVAKARATHTRLHRATLWTGVLPVLLIALGSFLSSLGLVYSTWTMRRRVGRVLKPARRRLDDRVSQKLTRALRFTAVIMSACSVLFLLRTLIYLQRPFSHQGCGELEDPDVCVVVGYVLPELVPAALFVVLMWEVEPTLEIPSRRSGGGKHPPPARVFTSSETTPLLKPSAPTAVAVPMAPRRPPYLVRTRRPSPLSLGLGTHVLLDRAKRQWDLVMRRHGRGAEPQDTSFSTWNDAVDDRPHASVGTDAAEPAPDERPQRTPSAWLSFQCFNLTLPSKSSVKSFVVLQLIQPETGAPLAELGRTEVSHSAAPCFHKLLAVEMRPASLLRASVYSVCNPQSLHDLNSQWLVGDPMLPVSCFMTDTGPAIGRACILPLYSPLSRTRSSGEIVVRCEADVTASTIDLFSNGLERITRPFMYIGVPTEATRGDDSVEGVVAAATSHRAQGKMLVEEELIESVYTWEVPYQLLQLILSDLLVKLDALKREIALEDGDDALSSTPSSQWSTPRGGVSQPIAIPSTPRALGAVHEHDGDAPRTSSLARGSSFRSVASSGTLETRVQPATSIGMLSEMIIHIQDDAMERKKRKWRLDLVNTMEQYISDVEDAILRYGATQHAGLTFKPSTMKADADLRFLALNLHQQLMTVGKAVPTSEHDVQAGDPASAARYARLVNSFVGTILSSPLPVARHHEQHVELDAMDLILSPDDEEMKKEGVASCSLGESPVEPVDALRRRVISFDSAETIVNQGTLGHDVMAVTLEQRKLAESIVAMGITEEEFLRLYGLDSTDDAAEGILETASSDMVYACSEDEMKLAGVPRSASLSEPEPAVANGARRASFEQHRMYGTTTVGAFAAHVYGFKSGGVRQMREELARLHAQLVKAAASSSDLTMDALERKYHALKWDVERRLEVAFCQAMSALVTCFQQTLYVHTHETYDSGAEPAVRACGIDYLEMLTRVGFLFSVESLLSTYGNELGMLGDTEAAVKELARVQLKLRPVKSPRAAAFRVSITAGPACIVIELPIILRRARDFLDQSMHRMPGQDARSGAIYLALGTPEERVRAKFLFQRPIAVVPVLFSQGVNEMQTVANTVGRDALQKDINAENVVALEAYVQAVAAWSVKKQVREGALRPLVAPPALARVHTSLQDLKTCIQQSGRSKRMAILTLSSSIARCVGGGRVTLCKSAKDRTSMSITLEEAKLLVRFHGLVPEDVEAFTNLLRTHGVRRENARKNIGKAQYCFSALQNYMLPPGYKCPPGTGGGSRAYS